MAFAGNGLAYAPPISPRIHTWKSFPVHRCAEPKNDPCRCPIPMWSSCGQSNRLASETGLAQCVTRDVGVGKRYPQFADDVDSWLPTLPVPRRAGIASFGG